LGVARSPKKQLQLQMVLPGTEEKAVAFTVLSLQIVAIL